jgi:hypothetical protein
MGTQAKFNRSISELQEHAVFWWPGFLTELESGSSVIPLLLKTQDKFLSILTLSDNDPLSVFDVIESSNFPANLFLKHLVVLSDFGGEQTQRLNKQFFSVFEMSGKKGFLEFIWRGKTYKYEFKKLPITGNLDNKRLGLDGVNINKELKMDELKRDIIMILLYGAGSTSETTANALEKCEIGNLIGMKDELEQYVKQKYLWVSRITGGAKANTLGQVAQTYIVDYLKEKLSKDYEVVRNGSIKVADDVRPFPFDVVISHKSLHVGVEITFQVTTNSTIERKAGQSKSRQELMHRAGSYIAYIIDGAGNFQRSSAISVICANSDCTVAFSDKEFDVLVEFIKSKI